MSQQFDKFVQDYQYGCKEELDDFSECDAWRGWQACREEVIKLIKKYEWESESGNLVISTGYMSDFVKEIEDL